ncbi:MULTISPECIES: DUF4097 family beta strand repeat-containing protein [Bacillaceae]|uniref:DUF4097 family beta strand repeat-containing protein n=1 Tax=Bacillaceae TaxID=186817 RepID=UPI000BFD7DAF|nr:MULTISPECIES: DUF4097 family beta strand repeat-containing protein [Bacillaceae]PGT82432.1 hypothetical protein COD11_14740 [Bacillus sp. AFS040349]UGB31321.1 DUF4097 domain-containing protein [Metabacillus sp. B2-18]
MKKAVMFAFFLIVVGIAGSVVTAATTDVFSLEKREIVQQEEVKGTEIQQIEVGTSSTNIKMVPSKGDSIEVKLTGKVSEKLKDKYKLVITEEGDKVNIHVKNQDLYFYVGFSFIELNLEIEVPEKDYQSLVVESSSGDIDISQLKVEEFSAEASSGDITIDQMSVSTNNKMEASSGTINVKNSSAKAFDVGASSGDIILRNVDGHVEAETSSGSIEMNNKQVTGNINAVASSGDVIIGFDESPKSLSVDFRGSSGDGIIELEGFSYEDKSENSINGKIGSGEYELKVRTSSGDFQLK